MFYLTLVFLSLIYAAPIQVVNLNNEIPEPSPVTYFGKVLPTDENKRPVYPRVTERGLPYPLDYALKNPDVFPTDSSGKPLPFKEGDPVIPTDEAGNFVIPDGTANHPNGELFIVEDDGTIFGKDLPKDIITCGCDWNGTDYTDY